ncbi:MAG: UDP-3-O-(3-hydroxymyristoyl)glucosamine N-acyltransferase [Phycisphaerae bacterium]|nr:UDP-3-O-(3-hydroxymyristoyl)glucosamine N-acyltransferase [Phycisphaerae bacterium]
MSEPFTVRQIAEWVGGRAVGDAGVTLRGVASIGDAGPEDVTFAADAKRAAGLRESRAGAAIVAEPLDAAAMPLVQVDDVQAAVAEVLRRLAPPETLPPAGIDPTASVAEDADVAADAIVGPGVVVAPGATIGAGAVLMARAVVGARAVIGPESRLDAGAVVRHGCVIGTRVRIGSNSVIGSEGYGYYVADRAPRRVPHAGNVEIDDDVEIGACSCVDRAKFGSTRIGAGTKVDNLVQIAHNVQIGRGCLLTAQVGIAGSARLGDGVVAGGSSGVRDNIALGDGVRLAAFCAVAADVPDGQVVSGIPAIDARDHRRIVAAWNKLPELVKRVRQLETKLNARDFSEDG